MSHQFTKNQLNFSTEKYRFHAYQKEQIDKTKKLINITAGILAGLFFLVSIMAAFTSDKGISLAFFGLFNSAAIFGAVWLYLLPTFFAYTRCVGSRLLLFLTNLLTGWLLIPWIVTLIWSLAAPAAWVQAWKQLNEENTFN